MNFYLSFFLFFFFCMEAIRFVVQSLHNWKKKQKTMNWSQMITNIFMYGSQNYIFLMSTIWKNKLSSVKIYMNFSHPHKNSESWNSMTIVSKNIFFFIRIFLKLKFTHSNVMTKNKSNEKQNKTKQPRWIFSFFSPIFLCWCLIFFFSLTKFINDNYWCIVLIHCNMLPAIYRSFSSLLNAMFFFVLFIF